MNKAIKLLLAFVFALSMTGCGDTPEPDSGTAAATPSPAPAETLCPPSRPEETEYTVITISTPEDLLQLSHTYGEGDKDYSRIKYVLTNNIDMSGTEGFVPIGTAFYNGNVWEGPGFYSVFDGQGYSVKNLSIDYGGDAEGKNGHEALGFFGVTGENAVIRNLNIENLTIDGIGKNAYYSPSVGGLAGYFAGTAENCHVSGSMSAILCSGGFIGRINGDAYIENCTADVDISGCWYTGGFLGYSDSATEYDLVIKNCASFGSVTAFIPSVNLDSIRDVGGFAGLIADGTIENCHSQTRMIINDPAVSVGAFIAHTHTADISDCTYNPDYTGAWEPLFHINFRQCNGNYTPYNFTEAKGISVSDYKTTIDGIETIYIEAVSRDGRYIIYRSDSTVAGDGGENELTLRDRNDGTEKKLGWVRFSRNRDTGFFSNGDVYVMDEYSGIRIYNTDMNNFHPLFSSNVNFPTGRNIDGYYKERYLFAVRRDPETMDYTVIYTEFVRGDKTPDEFNYCIGRLDTQGNLVHSTQLPEKVQWGEQLGFLKLQMFKTGRGEIEFYTTYKDNETMRGRYNPATGTYTAL